MNETSTTNSAERIYELTITWICILFGLPGNLMTIILCYRSLTRRHHSISLNRTAIGNESLNAAVPLKPNTNFLNINNNAQNHPDHSQTSIRTHNTFNKSAPKKKGNFQNSRKSFELFLIEISFFDFLMLFYKLIDELVEFMFNKTMLPFSSLVNISDFFCKIFIYINRINGLMCMWLTFAITFIRCVVICTTTPTKFTVILNSLKTNFVCFATLLTFCIVTNVYVFFAFGFVDITQITQLNKSTEIGPKIQLFACMPQSNNTLMRNLNNIGFGIIGLCVPAVSILIMNAIIIYRVIESWYKLKKAVSEPEASPKIDENKGKRYEKNTGKNHSVIERHVRKHLVRFSSLGPMINADEGDRARVVVTNQTLEKKRRNKMNTEIFNHLLAVSLSYIFCYLPYCISYIFNEFSALRAYSDTLGFFGYHARYLSHSITFYAYMLTAKRFRNDFVALVNSALPCRHNKDNSNCNNQ